jgi:glutathione S-transferase
LKLFLKAGACSLSPHIVLEESGLPYETEAVDLKTKITASGANFLEINPKGYVPALMLDNGVLLTEGPAIVQYIADQAADRKLAPANGSIERYQVQGWLTLIGTEIHKSFSTFFNPAASDDWKAGVKVKLESRLSLVNAHLAGKSYLMGDAFSVADAYLFTVLRWAPVAKLDLAQWPEIVAFQARMAARPAVQEALAAEGLA